MNTKLASFLALLIVGAGTATQAVINARLSKYVGVIEATFISVTGTWICISLLLLTRLGATKIAAITTAPPYLLIGGLFGLAVLLTTILLVPVMGTGNVMVTLIAGQLFAAVIFDQIGIFGMPRVPVDPFRIGGVLLVAVGMRLVFR